MLILSGLPGSGKSVYARDWVNEDPDARLRFNYDDARVARYGPDWVWNRKEENEMQAAVKADVITALKAGLSVCIDNTNLSGKVRERWAALGKSLGAEVIEQEIDTPLDECIRRDRNRKDRAGGRVGRGVIERMALFGGFMDFAASKRPIAIFDIDGTLANCDHRAHYVRRGHTPNCTNKQETIWQYGKCLCGAIEGQRKDWKAFYTAAPQDEPIKPIIELAKLLAMTHEIILLSGRDTSDGIMTEEWLEPHLDGIYSHLFLRQAGDYRKDYEHKLEILSYIPRKRIDLIFEDRDQCVKAFREKGFRTLQVAEGAF